MSDFVIINNVTVGICHITNDKLQFDTSACPFVIAKYTPLNYRQCYQLDQLLEENPKYDEAHPKEKDCTKKAAGC